MIKQSSFFLIIIMVSCGTAQEPWQKYQFSRINYQEEDVIINRTEFRGFLDLFFCIPFPLDFNTGYKDSISIIPPSSNNRSFKIDKSNLINFLKINLEELSYNYYDTDSAMDMEVVKEWYARQAFVISPSLVGITVNNFYYTTDPVNNQSFLYIFNTKGEILDSMILKGSINEHGTYDSFVLLDAKHFKAFRYTINESNTELIDYAFEDFYVQYKDEEGYRSKCVITDYKITEEGKIKQISTSDPILLKQDAWKYTDSSLPSFKDDPMNQDWEKYVKEKGY